MIKQIKLYVLFFGILIISAHHSLASPPAMEEDCKESSVIAQ